MRGPHLLIVALFVLDRVRGTLRAFLEAVSRVDAMQHQALAACGLRQYKKGTRVLISLWDSLMFGRVPKSAAAFLGTHPNISESHSEISTRVPFCIVRAAQTCMRGTKSASRCDTPLILVKSMERSRYSWIRKPARFLAISSLQRTDSGTYCLSVSVSPTLIEATPGMA